MKKFTKIFACIAILAAASACSESKLQDDAISKLEAGLKKAAEIKSLDYALELNMESENMTAKMYGSVAMEEEIQLSLLMDIASKGVKADKFMELYVKDNTTYMSIMGQKQKQSAGLDTIPNISLDPDTITLDKKQAEKIFSEATLEGDTLHLVLDKKLLDQNKSKIDTAASGVANIDKINNVAIDIEFEKDFMKKVIATIDVTSNGKTQKMPLTITFENINGVKEVSLPDDLDTYVESVVNPFTGIEE